MKNKLTEKNFTEAITEAKEKGYDVITGFYIRHNEDKTCLCPLNCLYLKLFGEPMVPSGERSSDVRMAQALDVPHNFVTGFCVALDKGNPDSGHDDKESFEYGYSLGEKISSFI